MKTIIYMILFSISFISANNLFPLKQDGKYGFIDKTGTWIIKPKYDEADNFNSKEFAKIRLNQKWGFIDKSGKISVKPIYDEVYNFTEDGLSIVRLKDKWGMINTQGKWIIKPHFNKLKDFQNNLAPAKMNKWWGFIDKNAKWVIKPTYRNVHAFTSNGLALVETENNLQKYINKKEEVIIKAPKYSYSYSFTEDNLAIINTDGKEGIMRANGNWLVKPKFKYINKITKSNLIGVNLDGKCGFIDKKGNWIIKPKFESVGTFYDKLATAKLNGKYGFINKQGEWVVEPIFKNVWSKPNHGLYRVKLDKKIGLINNKGKFIIKPKYDDIHFTDDKLFKVLVNQKYGLMDIDEKFILKAKFTDIQVVGELIKVIFSNKEGYTTKLGKYLTFTQKELNESIKKFSNSEGIVTIENIEYQNKDIVQKNWLEAKKYCTELNLKGKGWRLPTINELDKISNVKKYGMNSQYPENWSETNKYTIYKGVPYFLKHEFLHTFSVSLEKNLIYPVKVWTNKNMEFPYEKYAYAGNIDRKGVSLLKKKDISLVLCVRNTKH